MHYTRLELWMREPPDDVRTSVERLMPHKGYSWTGYSGAAYGLQIVWVLELWNVSDRTVLLLETLLSEYVVEKP